MAFNYAKKILILAGAAIFVSLSFLSPLKGQAASSDAQVVALLQQILAKVNNLPTYITAWTTTDSSEASANMQANFTQLGQLLPQDLNTQVSLQSTLNNNFLSNDGNNVYAFNGGTAPTAAAPTAKTFPYANDLVYSSLLGAPIYSKDPRPNTDYAMNYVMNASGANLYHPMPGGGWGGSQAAQRRYQTFYNTVMAATSFNNFILSKNYADKAQFNTLQTTLIQQATDPGNWFAKVGSEQIGFVLRQLLMYQSQTFVLLTEMIQMQKEMVSAQAMNTATLIAVNQMNESSMINFAKGQQTGA
jgi:hypothetical protein